MTKLRDLLSVDLVLLHLAPYLSVSALLNLASVEKGIRHIVHETPGAFRHLDLSTCKGGSTDIAPIDRGGLSWRAERMDENLSEDDFYSGPLRGIFSKFRQWNILRDIQTLILDRQTVTAEIANEIICGEEFRVKVLSLLEVQAMNMGKLRQTLNYACRTSRPEGTPKLQGLYIFSDAESYTLPGILAPDDSRAEGVTVSSGAQLGGQINFKGRDDLFGRRPHPSYVAASGRSMLHRALGWEGTLNNCKDIIAFDMALCRGPRHDPLTGGATAAIASVYLGTQGCETCKKMPEGFAFAGKSTISEVPLLRPVPTHSSSARTAQMIPYKLAPEQNVPFVARCRDCVSERWCEGCNRFWCEDCYTTQANGTIPIPSPNDPDQPASAVNSHIKVVDRECRECGYMCRPCIDVFNRNCKRCGFTYCKIHHEGSSNSLCDWCSQTRIGDLTGGLR